eukprot:3812293-Pyramimonas_sp.AAC.2
MSATLKCNFNNVCLPNGKGRKARPASPLHAATYERAGARIARKRATHQPRKKKRRRENQGEYTRDGHQSQKGREYYLHEVGELHGEGVVGAAGAGHGGHARGGVDAVGAELVLGAIGGHRLVVHVPVHRHVLGVGGGHGAVKGGHGGGGVDGEGDGHRGRVHAPVRVLCASSDGVVALRQALHAKLGEMLSLLPGATVHPAQEEEAVEAISGGV